MYVWVAFLAVQIVKVSWFTLKFSMGKIVFLETHLLHNQNIRISDKWIKTPYPIWYSIKNMNCTSKDGPWLCRPRGKVSLSFTICFDPKKWLWSWLLCTDRVYMCMQTYTETCSTKFWILNSLQVKFKTQNHISYRIMYKHEKDGEQEYKIFEDIRFTILNYPCRSWLIKKKQ